MVDGAASLHGMPDLGGAQVAETLSGIEIAVSGAEGLSGYRELASRGVFAPAQSPIWVDNWIKALRPDFLVATISRDGRPALSLALEVTRRGPLRIATFMGGRHANGNMPAVTAAYGAKATAADMRALADAISKARPDIDVLALERLAASVGGVANPLLLLPHMPSPNVSLAVDLTGGFNALLARASGKRKRKKHRSQIRKFESAGGFRRVEAKTTAETNALLDAFFAMKEVRFRKMGVRNVFAEDGVKNFFRAIFSEALRFPKPPYVLHALEVGGIIRAVTGSSRAPGTLVCEFGAIAEDDMAYASPGEFLFFDNIEEACNEKLDIYDFSVGDEPYKRLWCDLEIRQHDVLVPLSAKGRALAAAMRATAWAKGVAKNNPLIWRLIKRLRKPAPAQEEPRDD